MYDVTFNCFVLPVTNVALCGAIVILSSSSGGVTVTRQVAVFPPADAVIVATPADTPVTKPAELTVAIEESLLDQPIPVYVASDGLTVAIN